MADEEGIGDAIDFGAFMVELLRKNTFHWDDEPTVKSEFGEANLKTVMPLELQGALRLIDRADETVARLDDREVDDVHWCFTSDV